jgi:hypothetical protein
MTQKFHTNFSARETQNEATSAIEPSVTGDHNFRKLESGRDYDPPEWLRFL